MSIGALREQGEGREPSDEFSIPHTTRRTPILICGPCSSKLRRPHVKNGSPPQAGPQSRRPPRRRPIWGWHKYALRPMGSNGCGSWCHAPPQAAVTNTFNRRSGWHCVENTIKVSAVRNSSHRCTRGVIFFGLIEAFQCLVLAKWLNK